MSSHKESHEALPGSSRFFILFLGLVQGGILYAAHKLVGMDAWPWTEPAFIVPWYACGLLLPIAIQLVTSGLRDRRLIWITLFMGLSILAVSAYTGAGRGLTDAALIPFAVTIGLAWFISLPFIQTWMGQRKLKFPYGELFFHSWSNANILMSAAAFTGVFWLVILLWAVLFNMIEIDLFSELFRAPLFGYMATCISFAAAVVLARLQSSLMEATRKATLNIMKMLLPLVSLLSIAFALALPFTGLGMLWQTGHATALMLALQIATVLFLNAAYQDGRGNEPYNRVLRRIIQVSVLTLPVYTGLCGYALSLRIGQYGWTAGRVWAALAVFTAGIYATGYAGSALVLRGPWLRRIGGVNRTAAVVIVITAIMANTPLLDPHRIAVKSQLERILKGRVEPAEFDFDYLRFSLGKRGLAALERLAALEGHPKADEIKTLAQASLAKDKRWAQTPLVASDPEAMAKYFTFYPEVAGADREFMKFLLKNKADYPVCFDGDCLVLSIDLDENGKDERIIFSNGWQIFFLVKLPSGWKQAGNLSWHGDRISLSEIESALAKGDFAPVAPEWPELRVGKSRLFIRLNENW